MERVVCLGSPLLGSAAARGIANLPGGMRCLGKSHDLLSTSFKHAVRDREIGMIAGNKPLGLGCIVDKIARPHDGSVALEETRLPGLTDHVVVNASHTGLNFSPEVARLTLHFLRHGRFSQTAP